jgi:hypothetical protein
MNDVMAILTITVAAFIIFFTMYMVGVGVGRVSAMNEALERGYATQCVGKEGVYWDCAD